ncbi:glycoside hydrolase family 13 protein [Protofrankia sp. BMG5.30]|uniref:glycoside hydrolase family 13 protein n=1 Tax=Protofrankia sp. BMG5.30 TaxID=1834514 RepID=UPI0009784DA5|nr:glycoside hydrolase family 13 protein [Protofrankia sp. BMG5.30]ONH35670.1 alpha-amylase [Protofrankia sp. BMG5.30]
MADWWLDAVLYEVYIRSFTDSGSDGVGDLAGITTRLPYLRDLGVDGIWITPFYRSPMADHGYDVADHRAVDPLFGDLAAFDALLTEAHRHGLKVLVDLVPNHSSNAHPAFRAALAAGAGAPERDLYIFRDGRGADGDEPPNNWVSVFGGPAWTRVADGQWYLHLFAPEQPDWNWRHPRVRDDHDATVRFWLDRGVDGFRIDVTHGLIKNDLLPDNPPPPPDGIPFFRERAEPHHWDQEGVHEIYQRWRAIVEDYRRRDGRARMLVGETWVADPRRLARYVRPDELHLTFAFSLLTASWSAPVWRTAIAADLAATAEVGAPTTWVLANHDVTRPASRYGSGETGLRRARAALLTLLALPGPVFLYQGDELGLPEVDVPPAYRQDPVWERSGHSRPGRDGCRVPLPWSGQRTPYGFSADGVPPWLPQPDGWAELTVAAQAPDPLSTLVLARGALALRRALPMLGAGRLRWRDDTPPTVLAFDRPAPPSASDAPPGASDAPPGASGALSGASDAPSGATGASSETSHTRRPADTLPGTSSVTGLTCVMSTADTEVDLVIPGRLVLASSPVGYDGTTLTLPPDTTVWLAPHPR